VILVYGVQPNANSKGKKIEIDSVVDKEDFDVKILTADVFYISGGSYKMLKEKFDKVQGFKKKIEGKILIGCSAGTFLICKYSINAYNWQDQKINKGLGLLPFSILCHFDVEKQKGEKLGRLANNSPSTPLLVLNECRYTTFYI
jgi:peptidase E